MKTITRLTGNRAQRESATGFMLGYVAPLNIQLTV